MPHRENDIFQKRLRRCEVASCIDARTVDQLMFRFHRSDDPWPAALCQVERWYSAKLVQSDDILKAVKDLAARLDKLWT